MSISNNKYVVDTFSPVKYDGVTYDDYEINESGCVRYVSDKSIKKLEHDSKGRNILVLYKQKHESVSAYISEILKSTFNKEISSIYIEENSEEPFDKRHNMYSTRSYHHADEKHVVSNTTKSKTPNKRGIICNETGREYKSYSAAAKEFGVTYDQFYNSLYDHGMFVYNGDTLTFKKLSND